MFGTDLPEPPAGPSTHVIVHRVGVDEVSQEVAAPEEDDIPQDVRDQTPARAKNKAHEVQKGPSAEQPPHPQNASLLWEEVKGEGGGLPALPASSHGPSCAASCSSCAGLGDSLDLSFGQD